MNLLQSAIFVTAGTMAVYGVVRPQPADEYPLAMATVYQKLAMTRIAAGDTGPFGGMAVSVAGNGRDRVDWRAGAPGVGCTLRLRPVTAAATKVAVACQGAAPAMQGDAVRKAVIEQVDAALTNRPFDPEKAQGETAWRWPGNVQGV